MSRQSKRSTGYSIRKATEIIAYEKGYTAEKTKLPRSKALRGSIQSWRNKLIRGYEPSQVKTKKVFKLAIKMTGIERNYRIGINFNGREYSGQLNQNIAESIINLIVIVMEKERSHYDNILKEMFENRWKEIKQALQRLKRYCIKHIRDWEKDLAVWNGILKSRFKILKMTVFPIWYFTK